MIVSVWYNNNVSCIAAYGIINGLVNNCCGGESCHSPSRCPGAPPSPGWGGPAAIPAVIPRACHAPSGPCPAWTYIDIVDIDASVPVAIDVAIYIPIYIPIDVAINIAVYITIDISIAVTVQVAIAVAVGYSSATLACAW